MWCQQPVGFQHSPGCPAYGLVPFEVRTRPGLVLRSWSGPHVHLSLCPQLTGEFQLVMFGKTDDQRSLTEQARLYVES